MENKASKQYETAANLNARIRMHEKYSTSPVGFHEWVFNHFHLQEGMKILECGIGSGALWYKNRDKIPKHCQITLMDLSAGMLEEARNNIGPVQDVDFDFTEHDIQDMHFNDGTFDVVIANHMLYHVANIDKAIRETKRVLKPGGVFFASTFGKDHLKEIDTITRQFVDMPQSRTSDRFCLENGCYQVLSVYGNLRLHIQEDALEVTDPQALIDYIMSGTLAKEQLSGDKFTHFTTEIRWLFQTNPVMHIQKDTGVFTAINEI